jgi:hypothetical protein
MEFILLLVLFILFPRFTFSMVALVLTVVFVLPTILLLAMALGWL